MKITVDRPCHESWENMLPDQLGKYCLSCQKSVVDFTAWTDAQVIAFFRDRSGGICGRFTRDQLGHVLKSERPPTFAARAAAVLLAGALSSTSFSTTHAASVAPHVSNTGQLDVHRTAGQPKAPGDTLRGRIIDKENIPVAGAAVWLDSTSFGTVTDSSGLFSLVISEGQTYSTIRIDALGYTTQLIPVTSLLKGCPVTLVSGMRTGLTGEVVVVGGAFVKRSWWQRLWRKN